MVKSCAPSEKHGRPVYIFVFNFISFCFIPEQRLGFSIVDGIRVCLSFISLLALPTEKDEGKLLPNVSETNVFLCPF